MSKAKFHQSKSMSRTKSRKKKIIEVILTITGTVVVATTFFIHQVKRERAKELKDEISQAQGEDLIREDINQLSLDVLRILQHIDDPDASIHLDNGNAIPGFLLFGSAESKWQLVTNSINTRKVHLKNAKTALSDTKLLALSLDDTQKYLSRIEGLEAKMQTLNDDGFGLRFPVGYVRMGARLRNHAADKADRMELERDLNENLEVAVKQTVAANRAVDSFMKDSETLVGEIRTEISATADRAKESYRHYSNLSYFLYPLGFVLGLAGKLIGLNDEESET